MQQRGEYRRGLRAVLGAEPAPSGGADQALEQITAEMEAIVDATYRSMGVDPAVLRRPAAPDEVWMQRVRDAKAKAVQSPLWPFWETTISPKYEDWKASREVLRSQPASWDAYRLWLTRAQHLRADVLAKGVAIGTPDLVDLSQGQGGTAASVTSSPIVPPAPAATAPGAPSPSPSFDRDKLLKWGGIGAAALAGVGLLAWLASSTKEDRAPYERYRYGYRSAR